MFYYCQMRWDLKGMSFRDLWLAEGEEARHAIRTIESGMVQHLYKVAAEQYVIVIGDLPSAAELDRTAMGRLPMHEHLIFEAVWPLEEGFTLDVQGYLKPRREQADRQAASLYYLQMAWPPGKRELDEVWPGAREALQKTERGTVLGAYRVAGRQRMIVIADAPAPGDLNALANLPALKSSEVEKVWALRDYHLFAEDVWKFYDV